jgi:DNA-binding transcriptional ArsR family regulator
MEGRGPERLLELAYGNHPKTSRLKPEGLRIIQLLRDGPKSMDELATALELDLTSPAARKHFYLLLRPLREKGMISVMKVKKKKLYHLSLDGFNVYWKEVKREAEYWLTERGKTEMGEIKG